MFLFLVIWAAVFALAQILAPKPKVTNAKPSGLGDFQFPTATEGRPVPLVWGTVNITGPNVTWYGGLKVDPIKVKTSTGLFSSSTQITGYQYSLGMQFALCRGVVDSLKTISVNSRGAFTGTLTSGSITIDEPNIMGGWRNGGNGGMKGTFTFYPGDDTQTPNAYMAGVIGTAGISYRGTCYGVWEGGYIGNSSTLQPWAFEIQRCPNPLSLSGGKHIVNLHDANPANVLYEVLTDPDWGLGYNSGDIDLTNFVNAGNTLYDEGNGFSIIVDTALTVADFVAELEKQIDGAVYMDRTSGKWTLKLIREDYTIGDVAQINETNLIEVKNFTRASWQGTSNNIHIEFVNRHNHYKTSYAMAQDAANIAIQGNSIVSVTDKFPGCFDRALASRLAWRTLRAGSTPAAKAQFVVNRTLSAVNVGDVVAWTDASLGFHQLPMRVLRVDLGKLENGQITLDVAQDVFATTAATFGDSPDSLTDPIPSDTSTMVDVPSDQRLAFEAPAAFVREGLAAIDCIWVGARSPAAGATGFEIWTSDNGDAYAHDSDAVGFFLIGNTTSTVNEANAEGEESIEITCSPDSQDSFISALVTATPTQIGQQLFNIVLIDSEFCAFQSFSITGSTITLNGVYRGLMDTVPVEHSSTTPVYFIAVSGALTAQSFTAGDSVDVKILPTSSTETLDITAATAITVSMDNRARKPYPPTRLALGGSAYPNTISLDRLPPASSVNWYSATPYGPATISPSTTDSEIGVEMSFASDGFVIGISFDKRDATNGGTHVVNFWTTGGSLLATKTVNEMPGLTQTAYFTTPVAVTASTHYWASYSCPQGHFSLDTGVFSGSHTRGTISTPNNAGISATPSGTAPNPANYTSTDYGVTALYVSGTSIDAFGLDTEFTRRDFRNTDEVKAVINEKSLPSDFPAANTTQYAVILINDPLGTPATLITTNWNGGANHIEISRPRILRFTAGVVPSTLEVDVATKHNFDGVSYNADQILKWIFSTTSTLSTLTNQGVTAYNVATAAYTAVATGTFTAKIGTALTANVEYQINGGVWLTAITASSLSGTIAVVSGNTVAFRHLQNTTTDSETLLEFYNGSNTAISYCVFTF